MSSMVHKLEASKGEFLLWRVFREAYVSQCIVQLKSECSLRKSQKSQMSAIRSERQDIYSLFARSPSILNHHYS
jgi:hypothetical protein